MDPIELKRFESRLLKLREELGRLVRAQNGDSEGGRDSMDEVDQATESVEREFGSLAATNARAHLHDVSEALERIKKGDFGLCRECGKPIPIKRLKALPFAHHCVECQQALEDDL